MRIAFTTEYGSNYAGIADVTVPVMLEYCARHGYEFRQILLPGTGADYYYKKNEYFRRLFLDDFDYIFYLDVDAVITNLTVKLESFIDPGYSLFITKHLGELNGGALMFANDFWGNELNDTILKVRADFDNEQNAIDSFMNYAPFRKHIKVLPHPAFNSFDYSLYPECPTIRGKEQGHWHEGDFVLHTPGLGIEHRIQVLKQYTNKIIR